MMEFVNGFRMTSLFYEMENNPAMFQTTNQIYNSYGVFSHDVLTQTPQLHPFEDESWKAHFLPG
jgi:hypothetical protein